MFKTIKAEIMIPIITLTTVSLLLVGGLLTFFGYRSTVSTLTSALQDTVVVASEIVNKELNSYKTIAKDMGTLLRLASPEASKESKETVISQRKEMHEFQSVFIIYENQESVFFGTPEDGKIDTSKLYNAAMQGRVYLTEPIISVDKKTASIAVSAPLWEGGIYNSKIVGVVIITFDAKKLSEAVNTISVGKTGSSYILDKNGTTIAHEDYENSVLSQENLMIKSTADPSLKVLAEIGSQMVKGIKSSSEYKYNGIAKICAYSPIYNTNGWSIAVNAPKDEFLTGFYNKLYAIGGVIAVFIFICVAFTIILSRRISNPIILCAKNITSISEGEIPEPTQKKWTGELKEMQNSINLLIHTLSDIIAVNEELRKNHAEGYILKFMDSSKFKGVFKEMIEGTNKMAGDLIDDTLDAMEVATQYGIGNFEPLVRRHVNEKVVLTEAFDKLQDNLKMISGEVLKAVEEAKKGNLSFRADESKFKASFKEMIVGINHTLDSIIVPMNETIEVMGKISQGDLSAKVEGEYEGDILKLKNSINETVYELSLYIGDINHVLGEISKGNLNTGLNYSFKGDFAQIEKALNNIVESLNSVMGLINESSQNLQSNSRQISEASQLLAKSSTTQSVAIEELNASVATILEQTETNSQNSKKASKMASKTKTAAYNSKSSMDKMLDSMQGINESSEAIGKIVKIIENIAFQTSILSINASIEAAGAGQYGKGFSVVATEVGTLSKRSSDSVNDTQVLIEDSMQKVSEGSVTANETSKHLNKILEDIESVAKIVEEISESSSQQAMAIEQIFKGIEQMTQATYSNSASAEENSAIAQELSQQADNLKNAVSKFTLKAF